MLGARWICLVGGLLVAACGGASPKGESPAAVAAGLPRARTAARRPAPVSVPEGGEPSGAQALAESVLGAPWNRDKATRLVMPITTLVDRSGRLRGLAGAVSGAAATLDDRLARLGARVTGTEVTIRLPGSVLFDFDSAELRPDAERTLADVAQVLRDCGERPVRVEGHTDSIASEEYNLKLSERRAASVVAWLVAHGVAARRLEAVGYGESRPVADNATPEGRRQNRRVEVVVGR